MRIKTIVYSSLLLCFGFLSCGGDTDSETTAADEIEGEVNTDAAEMINEVEETEPVDETIDPLTVPDKDWQINNYAVYLNKEDIAENQASSDPNTGAGWYYETLDVKGGYANVTGAIDGWKEYVVWRMADGDDLVGEMTAGCGPACEYNYNFYKGRGSDIALVEMSTIFPLAEIQEHQAYLGPKILAEYPVEYPEDSQIMYKFPQKGTGMVLDVILGADEIQVPLLKLGWNKTAFFIEEKYEEVTIVQ